MNLSDQLNNSQPQSQGQPQASGLVAGNELALAMASQLQSDALAMAGLAEQYSATKERLADQLAPLFQDALDGNGLMGAVMARLTIKPMLIKTDIEPIDISSLLPRRTDPSLVEQFKAFTANCKPPAIQLPPGYGGTDED